jgi:hypothetical protein
LGNEHRCDADKIQRETDDDSKPECEWTKVPIELAVVRADMAGNDGMPQAKGERR